MIGKTLALTIRSIREDSRLLRTHLFRTFLLLFVFWFLLMVHWESMGIGAPGLEFFMSVAYLNFTFISIAGVGFFASAITEEKEEMTLGLLRMAGIGPLALLSGKSMPRMFGAVLLLSAQFPFTLLAITLGGVTIHQVTATYYTLLSYTLLLANVALFCSVVSRRTSRAAFATAAAITLFLFVPWWLFTVAPGRSGVFGPAVQTCLSRLYEASPLYRLGDIMTTGFSADAFGYQAISNTIAAVMFFLLSWVTFDRFNRDEQASSPARGWISWSSRRMRRLSGRRVWGNALFWKDYHFIAGGPLALLLKFLVYGLLAVGLAVSMPWLNRRSRFDWEEFADGLMLLMLFAFLVEGAVLASNVFQQEVKWKTHSSLMMLPKSLPAVAYPKIAGCLFGLLPCVAWFCVGVLLAPNDFGEAIEYLVDEPGFWWMAAQYFVILHLVTFLSLFIKWAALPTALGIIVFTNWCCLWTMFEAGGGPSDGPMVMMCLLGMFAVVVLHFAIAERLRTLSSR